MRVVAGCFGKHLWGVRFNEYGVVHIGKRFLLLVLLCSGFKKLLGCRDDACTTVGCRNLQFDDCTWGAIVGDAAKQRYKSLGLNIEDVKAQLLKVNNLALENRPGDMVITSHICRGNYHSTFFTSGPYDSVADYVFAQENVDALFLEYDDARSGGFAPLAKVSPDKKVVLGLITTKRPELEDKDAVIARIHEAEKYIPIDRLCLSPQCGFASCEIGNKITEEQQWAKLALVKEIAQEVWKKTATSE